MSVTVTSAPAALYTELQSKSFSSVKVYEKDGQEHIIVPRDFSTKKLSVTVDDLTVSEPATVEKIAEKIELYGGCIVRNYLKTDICDKIWDEVKPFFVEEEYEGSFHPNETKRVCGTMGKSRTAAENLLIHPLNLGVAKKFLGQENMFAVGDKFTTGTSNPQHNACVTFDIRPGAPDQVLHRDDMVHHHVSTEREKFEYGHESAVLTCVGLSKTTKMNGATRFVPGSHLWSHYRIPEEDECVYAELEKGDAFIMLASCFHGGSANKTKDEHRLQVILAMTKGTYRQEENIFLETPIEYFKSLSVEALRALGLTTSTPFLGFIRDLEDPLHVLKPETAPTASDKDIAEERSFIVDP